ncbi:hypothetical protein LCX93_12195 [Sulfurimonas sp. SWIR-19]|uniref:hypothetical protein n=1 Tax=Sulfurimonas sp. SWIR-19 TaxID=2878390 RepID=UPI001CF43743|nr:hypothetical protein [Sulfurimonas sp. SWIR-19]UCN00266.1 hypothetical protein LCX93_12195 [Sulfurimonas sp. SWIR-19]
MQILCTDLFEKQLQDILQELAKEDFDATKNFKIYLDTVIINIPTKAQKYKQSVYFNDENIKDLEHQGFVIPFFIDKASETYLVLGIVEK